MNRIAEHLAWLVTAAAAAVLAAPAAAQERKPEPRKPLKPVRVQLIGVNDFHGHLEPTTSGTIARKGERLRAGGAAYLATHVRELRRRTRHTFTVAAGDLVGGSPLLSSLFHDEPAIEAMNAIGLDAGAVGNHEFDEGVAELKRLQRGGCHPVDGCADGTPYEGADFPFLAANVVSRRTRKPIFPPYVIKRAGPVKIGFIGMTLQGTPEFISPTITRRLVFRDEAATANRYVRKLKRRGVRAIVVLLHEGNFSRRRATIDDCPRRSGPLRDIVRRTSRAVDAFLTGHTHAAYACRMYGRPVASAGSYGRLVSRVHLELDRRTGEVRRARSRNWIVGHWVMQAPDLTALVDHYRRFAAPLGERVIGRLAEPASRWRHPSGESRLGNLVADAQAAAGRADIALTAFGHTRAGLPGGDVSYARAFLAQPFGVSVVTMTLTGAQVLDLLKEQWCGRHRRAQILQPSAGLSYVWSAPVAAYTLGKPCASAPNPVWSPRIGGRPLEPARRYRVAVNSGMAGRTRRWPTLARGTEVTGGPQDVAALEEYLEPTLGGAPLVPPPADRIRRAP